MIEGALWRKWVFYNIPLILFVFVLLLPFYWMIITTFRPDGELYRPWRAVNNTPFWTTNPTFEHVVYLLRETMFGTWLWNTMFIAIVSTLISLFSLIESAVPAGRLNEAMGFVQTGMSAGIAPGAWGAGVVADAAGGSAAYWVCVVSAVLAALAGVAVPNGPAEGGRGYARPGEHVDELGGAQQL